MNANQTATHGKQRDNNGTSIAEIRCLDITDIDLFDKNPRRSKNPVYDRIRDSILANGLDQPLIVTRRPGHQRYIVHAGGNTRLQILKELNAVSDNPTFSIVNCIFVEWNSESSVLLAHLRENDLRGDLSFIDKAVAICALDELLAKEYERNGSTIQELRDVLKKKGYGISGALISYMRYAVNVLLPAMPVALADGLGRRQIHKIRRLQHLAGDIWVSRELGDEEDFNGVFTQLCRRYDSPDWQFESLQTAVETEIAEATDSSVQVIRIELQCRAGGRTLEACAPEPRIAKLSVGANDIDADNRVAKGNARSSAAVPFDSAEPETKSCSADKPAALESLRDLRCQAYSAAESLARRHGIADTIVPMPHDGLGYMVASVPTANVIDNLDDELRAAVCYMWWQLVSFSETLLAPDTVINRYVANDSELQPVIRLGNTQPLLDRIWSIEPGCFADRFCTQLSNDDWQDWLSLANVSRQLHRISLQQEKPLWECQS